MLLFDRYKLIFVLFLVLGAVTLGQTSALGLTRVTEQEAAEAEMRANTQMIAGNYQKAIPEIDTVLEYIRSVTNEAMQQNLVAKAEKLFFNKAFCFVATEQYEEAVPLLDRFLTLYPRSIHRKIAFTLKIMSLSSLERWEDMRDTLEFVLQNMRLPLDERMEYLMSLAEVNRTLDRHEEAFPLYGSVMMNALDPSLKMNAISRMLDSILRLQKTEYLYKLIPMLQGRVSPAAYSLQFNLQAIDAADRLMEAEIHSPALVLLKLCKPIEDIREGLTEVEGFLQRRLKDLQTDEQGAVSNLYKLIAVQSRLAQVQAEIEAAATANEYNEGLQYRIAQLLSQMDMQYESYWAYDKLLSDYPESENAPLALFSTSAIAAELGLPERAIDKGRELLERFPEFELAPETAFNLAYVYEQNQEIGNMLDVLQDAIDRKIVTRKEPDKGHAYFLMGYANLFLDNFETAVQWFDRVRNEVPNSRYVVDADYWSAYSLMFSDDYPKAITQLKAFLTDHPASRYTMDATYRLALAHFGSGELESTKRQAESFIKTYPDSTLRGEAYNLMGDVYGGLGLLDEAIEAYHLVERFTSKPGQVHSAVFNAGRIMEADARWSQMADHFQRYLNRYGEEGFYTRAVYEMGKAYKNSGRTDAALNLYWETFLRFANDPSALKADMILADYVDEFQAKIIRDTTLTRAKAREEAREKADSTPEAREAVKSMSAEQRRAAAAAEKLAEQQQAEQDRIEATAEARQRVIKKLQDEMHPPNDEGNFITKNLRLNYALAREGVRSAVPTSISLDMVQAASPEMLLWLANLLEQRDQLDLAAVAYQRILDDFTETLETVTAYIKLGTLELNRENPDNAMMYFRTVYEQYPTSEWTGTAAMRMADILYQQEKYEEAAEIYEEIVLVREWRGPLWPEALYKTGLCILQGGDTKKAFAYFQRVYVLYASHHEWAAKAYLESGKCLEKLNRPAEAALTYQEMLEIPSFASTPAGEQARKRLANLPPPAIQAANESPGI